MDGVVIIGLVPVRTNHVVFLRLGLCVSYFLWTIVDVVLGIGGGEWRPAYDDDALYPVLRWKRETTAAAILVRLLQLYPLFVLWAAGC